MERDLSRDILKQLSEDLRLLGEHTAVDIYVETFRTQKMLKALCPGVSIHRLPYFAATRAVQAAAVNMDQGSAMPVFGLMGRFGVASKNNREVVTAITDHDNPQIKWVIQTNSKTVPPLDIEPDTAITRQSNVHWLGSNINDHEYYNAFGALSCVVMVFPQGAYEWDGSGVFYEAVLGRKILILPAGCGLLDELTETNYPIITYERTQPRSLSKAVQFAMRRHDHLVRQAQQVNLPPALTESPKRLGDLLRPAHQLEAKSPIQPVHRPADQ